MGAASRKRPERSFPKKPRKETRKRKGKVKPKREGGGKLIEKQPLARLFSCFGGETDRQRAGLSGTVPYRAAAAQVRD